MTTEQYLQILQDGNTPATGDIVSYGLINALTVMLVVFAVLGILYLILSISGAIFARQSGFKQKSPKTAKPEAKEDTVSEEILAVLSAAVGAAQNDGELIAVLTAAVHAARAEAGETSSFKVVSFRRR
ncbi:MAG: OadG family protein [Clostridia bacterium]|nr:OadG family protein [Clostridia bacterium]